MAIERIGTILEHADANGYAVAAINVFNFETTSWAIKVAEEEGVPIIIQFYPKFVDFIQMDTVTGLIKDIASKVDVPVAIHLDHSDTYREAVLGINSGFDSVMIDGSMLPYEENIALTQRVVEIAKIVDIDVEAEIGVVGSAAIKKDFQNKDSYTKVEEAVDFVEKTGVDLLAISIGNGHGNYISPPLLDFERINSINNEVKVPLVLHGGSGIPDEQIRKAVVCGIRKVNIATEYYQVIYDAVGNFMQGEAPFNYMYGCMKSIEQSAKEFIRKKICLLNQN